LNAYEVGGGLFFGGVPADRTVTQDTVVASDPEDGLTPDETRLTEPVGPTSGQRQGSVFIATDFTFPGVIGDGILFHCGAGSNHTTLAIDGGNLTLRVQLSGASVSMDPTPYLGQSGTLYVFVDPAGGVGGAGLFRLWFRPTSGSPVLLMESTGRTFTQWASNADGQWSYDGSTSLSGITTTTGLTVAAGRLYYGIAQPGVLP
ncbi:MAG: hypothetical protein AAGH15_27940, partial [Myxococcota bacterium]